jgi:serine/threonine protein kinase
MSDNTRHELPQGILLHERYRIERVLGAGGFGITYLCRDERLQRQVCIKEFFLSGYCTRGSGQTVITQGLNAGDFAHFRARFSEEARALARFRHPGIVQVHDVFEEHNTAYYTMDYVEGETLKALVQRKGTLPLAEAMPFMHKLLDAVEAVHAADMLHRDIKPDNIMVRADGQPVLIDFGSARQFSEGKTLSQTAILTPGYAPPEQYSEKARRGIFTDVYSLGATFYFILTGVRPLSATDRQLERLQAPHVIQTEIPVNMSNIIMLAMNIKPENRFESIEKLRRALSPNIKSIEQVKWPKNIPKRTYLSLVALLLLSLLGYRYWNSSITGSTPESNLINNDLKNTSKDTIDLPEKPSRTLSSDTVQSGSIRTSTSQITEATQQPMVTDTPLNSILKRLLNNMVYVQGGNFSMGCSSQEGSSCDEDEKPAHTVQLSSFFIGKYEITQEEWEAVMNKNPSKNSKCMKCPVENVNWNEIQTFINKLNHLTKKQFRLPTEAEWEFAARGGIKSAGYNYSGSDDLGKVGWFFINSDMETHPVGEKLSNELGLFDMSGNVWEICSDWYNNAEYKNNRSINPKGPPEGDLKVLRGGAYYYCYVQHCRSIHRDSVDPKDGSSDQGFRLVLANK